MPVEAGKHASEASGITEEWKAFIDAERIAMQNGKSLEKVQASTIQKMLQIAESRGYDISKVRPYTSDKAVAKELGSSLDALFKLAQSTTKKSLTSDKRWKIIFKSAGKRLGSRVLKVIPFIGYAITAATIAKAASDPAGAIADEFGVSRDTAQALLDGQLTFTTNYWKSSSQCTSAQLTDGSIITVGGIYWVWKAQNLNPPPAFGPPPANWPSQWVLRWIKQLPITQIHTTSTPGVVDVVFDDGTDVGLRASIKELSDPPPYPLVP